MKSASKEAPLILNIEMNISEPGINPKTADDLDRYFYRATEMNSRYSGWLVHRSTACSRHAPG
ncbi:hypothetical protein BPA30113_00498 [Burkholderia paludis]|uniref:Uncharacterized protein n=1 Tax=Burkholderia paludis TaxID=1506587 RepID=A0A6J5D850_9BURK|nr:hypothetical protein LMG30113_00996 [Burkholderia paludis]VWB16817.1 hypothetical protein BPA30113_00498 [Burkholderia paludis]